jgi:ribosomal-protein-alanine N-acetyltransferase
MAATPADVAIRPFAVTDREAAIALLDSDPWRRLGYGRDDWLRLLATPLVDREAWVATTGDTVAGLAVVRPRFLTGDYLEVFAVAEAVRGQRCGAVLLAHVERVVFARARNFFVCVSDFNLGARRFYARHGYARVGTLPDLLVGGSAELLLRKTTGPLRAVR